MTNLVSRLRFAHKAAQDNGGPDDLDTLYRAAADEIERLREALQVIASGSVDELPPFRNAPHDVLSRYAAKALRGAVETKP
jgi:hypothetical protein